MVVMEQISLKQRQDTSHVIHPLQDLLQRDLRHLSSDDNPILPGTLRFDTKKYMHAAAGRMVSAGSHEPTILHSLAFGVQALLQVKEASLLALPDVQQMKRRYASEMLGLVLLRMGRKLHGSSHDVESMPFELDVIKMSASDRNHVNRIEMHIVQLWGSM